MNIQRVVVLGSDGQIGRALASVLQGRAVLLPREQADFAQPETVIAALEKAGAVDAVINAAAYTQVDKAESEEAAAYTANADAPGRVAAWCAARNIPMVHYSTDYVFDGSGEAPKRETDATGPLNAYGRTKLAGEEAVAAAQGKYLIFRTSWVYDAEGANFLNTMLRLGNERESLSVVSDQHGAPSYAGHLAAATVRCLDKAAGIQPFPSGVYHFVNTGETSWHGFATAIFAAAMNLGIPLKIKTVEPIAASAYPTPAKRPSNSRLNCAKLHTVFGERLPHWEQGLAEALEKKRASHHLSH